MPKLGSLFLVGILAGGCATEEEVRFGEPGRVTGGFEGVTVTGGSCQVNGACTVSWRQQIFGQVLDGPPGACGAIGCHRDGAGNFVFPADSDAAYESLLAFDLPGGRPYVVPCEPALSHIMCNLRLATGVENPYVGPDAAFTGGCGSSMPKADASVGSAPLSQVDLDLLVEWVLCGAPRN